LRIQRITLTALALAFLAAAASPLSAAPPDITVPAGSAIKTSTGKTAVWGAGTLNLSDADTVVQSNGQCAFTFTYTMINLGGPTAPGATFGNNLKTSAPAPAATVSHQTALSLTDNLPHPVTTQAYLHPGPGVLNLYLDDDGAAPNHEILESNERNNFFAVKYNVDSKCAGGGTAGKPDLVVTTFGFTGPTQGHGTCKPKTPVYIFQVTVKNQGTAPSPSSASLGNKALVDVIATDKAGWGNGALLNALAPGASQTVDIPVYYLESDPAFMWNHAPHPFIAHADWLHIVNESNEGNNDKGPINMGAPADCPPKK
jgi:hypothetical protein